MTLKHMPLDQESHNHTEERSAFSPSLSYFHQLILTTAINSVYPQSQRSSRFHPGRRGWVLRKSYTPPESRLDWQSINATSFLGESENIGCQCRIKLGNLSAEKQGVLKAQEESGKRRTRKSHSACQLTSLQLKYCWLADMGQEKKCF